jgi:serine/threonine-protein kinase
MVSARGVARRVGREGAVVGFVLMVLLLGTPPASAQQEYYSNSYVPNAACRFVSTGQWLCQGAPPQLSPKFAAIAVSNSTREFGTSWGYDTRQAAEQRALQECGKRAKDCEVAIWAFDQCAALAIAPDGSWGVDRDISADFAQAKALKQCTAVAKGCQIRTHPCARD